MNYYPKIDAHMHVGRAYKSIKDGNIDLYLNNCYKNNIKKAIVIPPCVPDYYQINYEMQIPFLIEKNENDVSYYKERIINNKSIKEPITEDPFYYINKLTLSIIRNTKNVIPNLHFAPLIHPNFFRFDSFILDEWKEIIAIKIHPGSFGISELSVPSSFFQKIEEKKLALILHTGYNNSIAYNWIKILSEYNINVLFTHACRLDLRCSDIINRDIRYFVGIAPHRRLSLMKNFQTTDNFLKCVFNTFDSNKIVFDTDYPENYDIETSEFYWDFESDFLKLNLSEYDLKKAFYENAFKLFKNI